MSNDNDYYLIRDWMNVQSTTSGTIGKTTDEVIFGVEKLCEIIDQAKQTSRRISVYKLGKCLIDWS